MGVFNQKRRGLYMENIVTTPQYLGFVSRHFPENSLPALYEYYL
jgi:hypothetical protein